MPHKWVTASASLRSEDYEKLKEICREQGLSVNQLLRRLIYQVIEKRDEVEPEKSLEALKEIESKVDNINKRLDNAHFKGLAGGKKKLFFG